MRKGTSLAAGQATLDADTGHPLRESADITRLPVGKHAPQKKDYFVERNGLVYAGTHLLLDFWGASALNDEEALRQALIDSVEACGATLLHIHLHQFSINGGISGVAVLAESHISLHTWPERGYAAFDIFMCGECDPYKAVPVLRAALTPEAVQIGEQKRGLTG